MSTGMIGVISIIATGPVITWIGGIPATYMSAGVPGVPLAFVAVTLVLALLTVGYTSMARHVPHPAVYYATVARGLGRPLGVAAGLLALVAYNAILCCMYGLLGGQLAAMLGGDWRVYAYLGWFLVLLVGVRKVAESAWLIGIMLAVSAMIIGLFVVAAFTHPATGHISVEGFSWTALNAGGGLGTALAWCFAAMMGFDGGATLSSEAVDPRSPGRAVTAAVWICGLSYAVVAWAMNVANGPDTVVDAARNPDLHMPLNTMTDLYGFLMGPFCGIVLVFAIPATQLSVHAIASRYGYGMAREGVLPNWIAYLGRGLQAGSPVGGSRLQSAVGFVVITAFAISGADPMMTLFPWGAAVGALGLVMLLLSASLATIGYLRGKESLWVWLIAPGLGVLLGGGMLIAMLSHLDVLLGVTPDSKLPVIIVSGLAGIIAAGLLLAVVIRARRPLVYEGISHSVPKPLEQVARPFAGMHI
jgi:amino acid transporter